MKKRITNIVLLVLAAILMSGCNNIIGDVESFLARRNDSTKAITAFSFTKADNPALTADVNGIINEEAKTISLVAPKGTVNLTPTIVHTGASISPASGAAQNFTNSVQYVVTAKDGSTQAYTVKVTISDHAIVTPPTGGVVGVAPNYNLPGTEDYWKGVFIKDRTVSLAKYAIANSEVTYKLWKEVYDWAIKPANGYTFANAGQKGSSGSGSDDEPVTEVSWRDTVIWCNAYTQYKATGNTDTECVYRASAGGEVLKSATAQDSSSKFIVDSAYFDQSKKGYRLPTEAEWEYAARYQGTDSTNAVQYGDVYLTKLDSASGAKLPLPSTGITKPSDKTWDALRDEASRVAVYRYWYNGSNLVEQSPATTKTASVKSKEPNALGLYDMSGNVWEWCWDWYGSISTSTPITGQGAGTGRVFRGGGWYYNARRVFSGGSWYYGVALIVSVGYRYYYSPDYRGGDLGFRLAWKTE